MLLKVETSKSSGAGETPSELIQSAGKTVCVLRSVNVFILLGIKKNCRTVEKGYYCTCCKMGDRTGCSDYQGKLHWSASIFSLQ